MAYFIDIPTFSDDRGSLSVIEKLLPFEIKRIYYIFDVVGKRGGHRHKNAVQALICLGGACEVYTNNGDIEILFQLDRNNKCLILDPEDWHTVDKFSKDATLLVLASELYDIDDYIYEPY